MIPHVPLVLRCHPAHLHRWSQPQYLTRSRIQLRRNERTAMLVKTQQELVEQRIEVRRQQQAIKNIQPLRIAIAHDPGFGVAGTQNGRQGQPGDRTRAPPIVQHGLR